jgi:hypothetical protein
MSQENVEGRSPIKETAETIQAVARNVTHALETDQTQGQWIEIVRGMVREAPLPSLTIAFLLGVLVARR